MIMVRCGIIIFLCAMVCNTLAKDKKSKLERLIQRKNISEDEVVAIIKSAKGTKPLPAKKIPVKKGHVDYGYLSDAHIGSKYFDLELYDKMVHVFNNEDLDFVVDVGDHCEGMSGRPGHVYELAHIGYEAQVSEVCRLYEQIKHKIYGIDGNHDQWFKQKGDNGSVVGEDLERRLDNYIHLGEWEGDLDVESDGAKLNMKLFHANDGSAYATSYKLQKLIESFEGGKKPHIVHSGHYHKALYAFIRNVHGFESATLCSQTGWMRGKKIPAHKGFGIVHVDFNEHGVERLHHEFYPGYD